VKNIAEALINSRLGIYDIPSLELIKACRKM
jgi:hypothetical protein